MERPDYVIHYLKKVRKNQIQASFVFAPKQSQGDNSSFNFIETSCVAIQNQV
jgi:hypothetical protein